MIRNNLSILMSERGIKNSSLSVRTGISKNTISSISQNDVKMIQLETINKMCQVLDIQPGDFFSFLPYDFEFTFVFDDFSPTIRMNDIGEWIGLYLKNSSFDLFVKVISSDKQIDLFELESINYSFDQDVNLLKGKTIDISISSSSEDASRFLNFFENIPVTFKIDIQNNVEKIFYSDLEELFEEYFSSIDSEGYINLNEFEVNSVVSNIKEFIDFKFLPFDNFQPF